ncbi:hypothetical protein FDECE_18368 [Fusarium decemcellulare]|nr:hypothetical protein FDECE_18368 [Fusarium decemcellulare]
MQAAIRNEMSVCQWSTLGALEFAPSDLLTRGFGFGLREREENVGLALQRRAPIGYVPGHPRELGEDKRGLGLGAAKGLG